MQGGGGVRQAQAAHPARRSAHGCAPASREEQHACGRVQHSRAAGAAPAPAGCALAQATMACMAAVSLRPPV